MYSPVISTLLTLLETRSVTGTEVVMQRLILDLLEGRFPGIGRAEGQRDGWRGKHTRLRLVTHKQSLVVFVTPLSHITNNSEKTFPRFVLLGHTDTVPGEVTTPRVDGDKVIGLGASDMKSGLACMLELLNAEVLDSVPVPVAFVFYAGEEGPGSGNELESIYNEFPELKRAKLSVFLEPTDRTIQIGCLGLANIKVTFNGKAAHSARPWNGVNAIHAAGNFISAVGALAPRRVTIGSVEYAEVTSITLAHGGTATNVVPAAFELNVNARVLPGSQYQERVDLIRELAGPSASVEVTDHQPAGRVPVQNKLYETFKRSVGVPEAAKQAYTDVGLLSELGVDAINFGPGLTGQCHVAGEYALISDIEWCLSALSTFMRDGLRVE